MKCNSLPTLLGLVFTTSLKQTLAVTIPRQSYQPEPIKWQNCSTLVPKGVDCATLSVPLNWDDPNGEKITLGMSRYRATDEATEDLFINTGGPGGIATEVVLAIASGGIPVSPKLEKKYNLSKSLF